MFTMQFSQIAKAAPALGERKQTTSNRTRRVWSQAPAVCWGSGVPTKPLDGGGNTPTDTAPVLLVA